MNTSVLRKESEEVSKKITTSEDERILIAEALGNKNQRKLKWIEDNKYVLLCGFDQMKKVCCGLLKADAFYVNHMMNIKNYPLRIPMSTLMIAQSAVAAGFCEEDVIILDPNISPGKDPLLILFIDMKKDIGAIVSQWE